MGEQVSNNRPNVGKYFMREQAYYVYKKTELGKVINIETLYQGLGHENNYIGLMTQTEKQIHTNS